MVSISGLPAFLAYMAAAFGLVALYLGVYLSATAHREIALIRANNGAAALALGGSLIGYTLPLAAAITNAQTILDCVIWGLVALVVQILIYFVVRLILPDLSRRIETGEVSAAILIAAFSLAGGLVDAAAMTY
jgi:putative membrane protein